MSTTKGEQDTIGTRYVHLETLIASFGPMAIVKADVASGNLITRAALTVTTFIT
jgi:hypothetical protein